MNNDLKKNEKYYKRYMKRHKQICVCFDREKDKDIVNWLESQDNISKRVKDILRQAIK